MAESQVALITGGAQGLGAAISEVLLKKGYKLCVSDVQEEKGKKFVKELQEKYGSNNVKFIVCDVSKEEDYKGLFDFTLKEFGWIDLVVNNAGAMLEQNPRKLLEINLLGPILGGQLALQYMGKTNGGKGGMVISTASIAGLVPFHAFPVYTASKHGVVGLTRSYGTPYHLDRDGVVFAALCPYYLDTELLHDCSTNSVIPGLDPYQGREVMTPAFVAEGVSKLLEDKINGSTLVVSRKSGYTYAEVPDECITLLEE